MVKVIRMNSHHYTHHADNDRDIIFGTNGDDWISGDDEEIYGFYWPANTDEAQIIAPSKGNWGGLISRRIESHGDGKYAFAAVEVNVDGAKPIAIDEYIDAGGGVDVVHGQNGNDWIYGGDGGDFLWGEWGEDVLMGGDGDDFIDTGVGMDSVNGGSGNDTVNNINASGGDFLDGGADYDKLRLERSSGAFTFDLMTGVGDVFSPGAHFNAINFEELVFVGSKARDDVKGGDNRDNLQGRSGNDNLEGRGGNDEIDGGAGADFLDGGDGDDHIFGGVGTYADIINGGAGNDELSGGSGNDTIHDGNDDDIVHGDDGDDTLLTGYGNDTIYGGNDNDTIVEAAEDDPDRIQEVSIIYKEDFLVNFRGNDVIHGEGGRDDIDAGTGNDYIDGGADRDTLHGGSGSDTIFGGSGIDNIHGDSGQDLMWGGADMDFFNFSFDDHTENPNDPGPWSSSDFIQDFERNVDRVNLIGINNSVAGGNLFFDDHDGTPGEACEIMFGNFGNNNTHLTIDFDGDDDVDFSILFVQMNYDPNNPFNTGDVMI